MTIERTNVTLDLASAQAIEGVLASIGDNADHPAHSIARALRGELAQAIEAPVHAPLLALAATCRRTLSNLLARGSTYDDASFVIKATESERDDEDEGIQVISEVNDLLHYCNSVLASARNPLADLLDSHAAIMRLAGTLHASMDELGFYLPEGENDVNGGDAVDMLSSLQDDLRSLLTDPASLPAHPAVAALAGLVDQLKGIGIPDWRGAEGLDLGEAEDALRCFAVCTEPSPTTAGKPAWSPGG